MKILEKKIIQRFGYFPATIALFTYFQFLHSFCYRPFLRAEKDTQGLIFNRPPLFPRYKLTDDLRYMTPGRRLYANRLAKFIEISGLLNAVRDRMEKYFDVFFVDEVQDFGGHDFNFLIEITAANLNITFVGDFFQHTFDTSRDGSVNANLHDNYTTYKAKFTAAKLRVDVDSLRKSYRCGKNVCEFITEKIGIFIESNDDRHCVVKYEDKPEIVISLYKDPKIVKLFLQEHYKYECYSQNWGAAKGADHYEDICVVLNSTNISALKKGDFRGMNPQTRNKLYVACSRARGDLIFIPEKIIKIYKRS